MSIYNYYLFCSQIRQEKPYYIADPEVDSLVSIVILRLAHRHDATNETRSVFKYVIKIVYRATEQIIYDLID